MEAKKSGGKEFRVTNWGKGGITLAVIDQQTALKKWKNVSEFIGPYFNREDTIPLSVVYKESVLNGCPAFGRLSEIYDNVTLMNIYVANNQAFNMVKHLLRKNKNERVFKLWVGNTQRKEGEERLEDRQKGTPKAINELNQHVGVAKYEDFSLCNFFALLTDAQVRIEDQSNDLPKGKNLRLSVNEYNDCAAKAVDLNDLIVRMVIKTLPNLFENGVTQEQALNLLLNSFLAESQLVGDNVWDRAKETADCIGIELNKNQDKNLQKLGENFLGEIDRKIESLRNK